MAGYTDAAMEAAIGRMLRVGVTLSALIVLAGGVLSLRQGSGSVLDSRHFHSVPASLNNLSGILRGAAHLDSASVVLAGLLLLIATPVARVVLCVAGFARQRDWLYVVISTTVLLILVYSLLQRGG